MLTLKKHQTTHTHTKFRPKLKPKNKICQRSLEEDFCPIILLECIIPCISWDKLVEHSASSAGFLRNQGKIYRDQSAARRISTREPLISDLFLWEKLHTDVVLVQQLMGFAWMPLVQFPAVLQTPSTEQRREAVTGRQVMVHLLVSSSCTTSSHQTQGIKSSVASALAPVLHTSLLSTLATANPFPRDSILIIFLIYVYRLNSKRM